MQSGPPQLANCVLRITGKRPEAMGTGFAVHQDNQYLYILTCRHVVDEVGDGNGANEGLRVEDAPAEVVCSDTREGFDLAVLKVLRIEAEHIDAAILSLVKVATPNPYFRMAGFSKYGQYSTVAKPATGRLQGELLLTSDLHRRRVRAWEVVMDDNQELDEGNSGAPIVNELGQVVGVVSTRRGNGAKGMAISIEALEHIWLDRPTDLFDAPLYPVEHRDSARIIMNFGNEIRAFNMLLSEPHTHVRLITVSGESGSGKTTLLDEYESMIVASGREAIRFDLRQQLTVERCLDIIVNRVDVERFPRYSQTRRELPAQHGVDELDKLTLDFFYDLKKLGADPAYFVLLDHFDDSTDSLFEQWLRQHFLEQLFRKPVFVIIAGQKELGFTPTWKGMRHYTLKSLSIDWYQWYAEQNGVVLDAHDIEIVHEVLRGLPSQYVKFIDGRKRQLAAENNL